MADEERDLIEIQIRLPYHIFQALDLYAGKTNKFKTTIIREALADFLGVSQEYTGRTRGRPRKYWSESERKEADAQRKKFERERIRQKLRELREKK